MKRPRIQTWLAVFVIGVGLLVTFVGGLHVYMTTTAKPLHPDLPAIPSSLRVTPSAPWGDRVDQARQIVRAGLAEQNLPGVSVAVGVEGDLVWAEGFGWADLENQQPVTPDTRFRIGTASMMLTSAAAGLLIDDGRLRLDERIQTYVPDYPGQSWPVTLRHVMGHTAGIRNDAGDEGPFDRHCERTRDGLQLFADMPLLFEPGTRYRFSSFGWILASAAIESTAGEPFLDFMRRRVFDPIGMRDTRPESSTEPVAGRATFYFPRYSADPRYGLHLTRPLDFSCYAGAYAFVSTPSDLVRFGMAITGGTFVTPATVAELQTAQRLTTGDETGYGLGWDLETVDLGGTPTRWVGHDGTTMGGMVASVITFREHGLVVAILSNIAYADVESMAVGVARVFARR